MFCPPSYMFEWKANCIFCGKICQKNIRHPDWNNSHEVEALQFNDEVWSACQKLDDQTSK